MKTAVRSTPKTVCIRYTYRRQCRMCNSCDTKDNAG